MTHRIGTIYYSKQFNWNLKTKTFTGDISELPEALRQMWNDSLDIGFGIQSARTGNTAFFLLDTMDTNTDGEILAWNFKVFNPIGSPVLEGLAATIFND
jgi:hypothetical protein